MIFKIIKPHVTTFTAAIKGNYNSGQSMKLGGKVLSILDTSSFMPNTEDDPAAVYLTVDDGLGEFTVFLPKDLFDEVTQKNPIQVGSFIVATGRLHELDMSFETKQPKTRKTTIVDSHPHKSDIRLGAYKISVLPEETEVVQEI